MIAENTSSFRRVCTVTLTPSSFRQVCTALHPIPCSLQLYILAFYSVQEYILSQWGKVPASIGKYLIKKQIPDQVKTIRLHFTAAIRHEDILVAMGGSPETYILR